MMLFPRPVNSGVRCSLVREGGRGLSTKAKIIYGGFYDVPLAFVVSHVEKQLFFLREFDHALDDYPDTYQVFTLPNLSEDVVRNSWGQIEDMATDLLGEIPIKEIEFDPMHRVWIDTKVIDARFGMK